MRALSGLLKRNSGESHAKSDTRALVKALLNTESSESRGAAAAALDELGWQPGSDSETMHYLLAKQSWSELLALRELAVKFLVGLLQKGNPKTRQEAARFLGELGAEEAASPLIDRLYEERKQAYAGSLGPRPVIDSIREALEMLGRPAIEPYVQRIIAQGFTARSAYERNGGPPAMVLMAPSGDAVATVHAEVLAMVGGLAVDQLIASLGDPDDSIRKHAAEALGKIRDERAVEPLIRIVAADDNLIVRWEAIEALGLIGRAEAVEPLVRALDDVESTVRDRAAEALGWIRSDKAVGPLTAYLARHKGFFGGGQPASEALERIRVGKPCAAVSSIAELETLSRQNWVLLFTEKAEPWKEASSKDLLERSILPQINAHIQDKGVTAAWANADGNDWRLDVASRGWSKEQRSPGCFLVWGGDVIKSSGLRRPDYIGYVDAAKQLLSELDVIQGAATAQ